MPTTPPDKNCTYCLVPFTSVLTTDEYAAVLYSETLPKPPPKPPPLPAPPPLPKPPPLPCFIFSPVTDDFHTSSPFFTFSATIVALLPPGVQMTTSPSTSGDSQ